MQYYFTISIIFLIYKAKIEVLFEHYKQNQSILLLISSYLVPSFAEVVLPITAPMQFRKCRHHYVFPGNPTNIRMIRILVPSSSYCPLAISKQTPFIVDSVLCKIQAHLNYRYSLPYGYSIPNP